MTSQTSGSAAFDTLVERRSGAYWAVLQELRRSAAKANRLLSEQDPLTPAQQATLRTLMDDMEALSAVLERAFKDTVREMYTAAMRIVEESTDAICAEMTDKVLDNVAEHAYLLHLRST